MAAAIEAQRQRKVEKPAIRRIERDLHAESRQVDPAGGNRRQGEFAAIPVELEFRAQAAQVADGESQECVLPEHFSPFKRHDRARVGPQKRAFDAQVAPINGCIEDAPVTDFGGDRTVDVEAFGQEGQPLRGGLGDLFVHQLGAQHRHQQKRPGHHLAAAPRLADLFDRTRGKAGAFLDHRSQLREGDQQRQPERAEQDKFEQERVLPFGGHEISFCRPNIRPRKKSRAAAGQGRGGNVEKWRRIVAKGRLSDGRGRRSRAAGDRPFCRRGRARNGGFLCAGAARFRRWRIGRAGVWGLRV